MRDQHRLENELEEARVALGRSEEGGKAAKKRAQEALNALGKSERERRETQERYEKAEKERVKLNEKYIKLSQRLKEPT
jgi:chromosome segregation ATPase